MREILDSGVTAQAVGEMGQENQTIRERVKRLEYEVKRLAARNNILEAQNAGLRIQLDEIKKAGRAYYEPSEKKTKDRSCKMVELIIQVLKVPMSMSQIAKHLKVSPQLVRYHLKRNPGIFTVAYNRASSGRTGAVNFWKVKDEYHKN
jgi:predicted RNase H-like nuclease (RuvC/YqgF family)